MVIFLGCQTQKFGSVFCDSTLLKGIKIGKRDAITIANEQLNTFIQNRNEQMHSLRRFYSPMFIKYLIPKNIKWFKS